MKRISRLSAPHRGLRAAFFTAAVLALGAAVTAANAGTTSSFTTGGSLLTPASYSTQTLPGNTTDVTLTTTTTALSITGGALTMESLTDASTTKSYTISTATSSTLTLGNSAGFTNSNDSVANDLLAVTGSVAQTLTISGANTGGGTGTLGLVLASSGNFDLGGASTLVISANISETGGSRTLTFTGNSTKTTTLSGVNSFTGGLVITSGEVDVSADTNLGGAGGSITINGGRLGIATNSFTVDPTRNIYLGANPTGGNATGSLSIKGTITTTFNQGLQNLSGSAGDLVKQGGGTLALGGASTYTGNTFLNNGITQLVTNGTTSTGSLPSTTIVSIGQPSSTNNGELDLNGLNQQIAGLNSVTGTNTTGAKNTAPALNTNIVTTSTGTSILTLGGSGTYAYGDGSFINSGNITGALAINKTGSGTQTFGGANTYTGSTTVSAGTLIAGTATTPSAVALSGTSGVFVNNGGTLQMGAANQFNATTPAPLTLNGAAAGAATFSVNGNSQGSTTVVGVGALTLTAASANNVIDFNGKNGVVTFASLTTNGATLTVNNYLNNNNAAGGPDELIFSQNESSNLGNIVFTGYGGATQMEIGTTPFYEVFPSATAVPEPTTVIGGLLMVGMLGWNLRRFRSGNRLPL